MATSPRMRRLAEIALSSDSPGIMAITPPQIDWYETDEQVLFASIVSLVIECATSDGLRGTDVLSSVAEIIGN